MIKAIKNIWRIIYSPLLYLGTQAFFGAVYGIIIAVAVGLKIGLESAASGESVNPGDLSESILSQINIIIPVILSIIVTFGIILLIFRKEWKAEKFWGFNKIRISPILLCIVIAAAMNILTDSVISLLPLSEEQLSFDIMSNNMILDFLCFAVLAPVLEELIFRGIVLKRLIKMVRLPVAVILQAFIFGLAHLNIIQGTYAFILGIIMGLIYLWFGSIWYSVVIHIIFNGTSVILSYVGGDSEINIFWFLSISAVLFIASFVCLIISAGRKKDALYPNNFSIRNLYNRWQF